MVKLLGATATLKQTNKQTKKLLHLKSWENKDNIRVGTEYLMKNALSFPASNAMGICFVSLKV